MSCRLASLGQCLLPPSGIYLRRLVPLFTSAVYFPDARFLGWDNSVHLEAPSRHFFLLGERIREHLNTFSRKRGSARRARLAAAYRGVSSTFIAHRADRAYNIINSVATFARISSGTWCPSLFLSPTSVGISSPSLSCGYYLHEISDNARYHTIKRD